MDSLSTPLSELSPWRFYRNCDDVSCTLRPRQATGEPGCAKNSSRHNFGVMPLGARTSSAPEPHRRNWGQNGDNVGHASPMQIQFNRAAWDGGSFRNSIPRKDLQRDGTRTAIQSKRATSAFRIQWASPVGVRVPPLAFYLAAGLHGARDLTVRACRSERQTRRGRGRQLLLRDRPHSDRRRPLL